jgi:sigma-54 specific flagellar transcriptional regulator A
MFIPSKSPKPTPRDMVGISVAIQSLRRLIQSLAGSSSTALITGESGTGKELVAHALHGLGPRAEGPFIPLNCGAIPRELIESELFGHRKGSFTGAIADRLGRFELAHGGTLFLDEIGDLPADMQVVARLARALHLAGGCQQRGASRCSRDRRHAQEPRT